MSLPRSVLFPLKDVLPLSPSGPIDKQNEELKVIIKKLWKRTKPKLIDEVIPPPRGTTRTHTAASHDENIVIAEVTTNTNFNFQFSKIYCTHFHH